MEWLNKLKNVPPMENLYKIFAFSLTLAICLGTIGTVSAQLATNQSAGSAGGGTGNNTGLPLTNTTNATSSPQEIKNMSNIPGTTQLIK
jgi:hypothetical protein